MKYMLVILFATFAHAGWYFPVGKVDAKVGYASKSKCENVESVKCFKIDAEVTPETHVVVDVEVDDKKKPLYAPKEATLACAGSSDCRIKIKQACTGSGVDRVCLSYCKNAGLPDDYFPYISSDFSEVYCTRVSGYEKKWVKKLKEDAAKKAAKLAEKQAEKDAKKDKKDRKKRLKDLRKKVKDLSVEKDLKDMLKDIIDEVL